MRIIWIPKIMNNNGITREKYPNAPRTNKPEITTPIIPSQFDVVKFEDWFSFLNISVTLKFSSRVSSAAEYDIMLNAISMLNIIRKNPRICFLLEIGNPSSYFFEEDLEPVRSSLLRVLFSFNLLMV